MTPLVGIKRSAASHPAKGVTGSGPQARHAKHRKHSHPMSSPCANRSASPVGRPLAGWLAALRFIPAKGLPTGTALVRRSNRLGRFLADRTASVRSSLSYYIQFVECRYRMVGLGASPYTFSGSNTFSVSVNSSAIESFDDLFANSSPTGIFR